METKILAIMLTDIQGFTDRTSQQSRSQLVDLLKRHRDTVLPLVERFRGRLVKSIGDAFLVVFESPTDAVLCGVAIQDAIRAGNEGKSAGERVDVRIAINSGEVVVADDGDIFGEPVNVTSRLESIAEVGQVFFTEAVYLAMNRKEVPSSEVGYRQFKGVPEKVKVYRVLRETPVGGRAVPLEDSVRGEPEIEKEEASPPAPPFLEVRAEPPVASEREGRERGGGGARSEPETIVLSCAASYALTDPGGGLEASGAGEASIGTERLSFRPRFGEPLFLPYRDIVDFSAEDYRLRIVLSSGEELEISGLGYRYEDFLRVFARLRNELALKDSLMHESLKRSGAEAECVRVDENGREIWKGSCEPRLYETGLVIVPQGGALFRIALSDVVGIRAEDFALTLTTETGETVTLSKLGRKYDDFAQALSEAMNELSLRAQSELKTLVPDADPGVLRRAARLLRDGKAARKTDLDAISPMLWVELEKRLDSSGLKAAYEFLKALGRQERLCIGMKRGLMGDLTGDYVWLLVPIYDVGGRPGNAVAMEASTGESGGRATYFFRIMGRNEYAEATDLELLHQKADVFIRVMNRCMLDINFRREPIYLPDRRLEEPQYLKYRVAVQKLPSLRTLRRLFIGRVVHANEEQWQRDVAALLSFNVASRDDEARWERGRAG